MSGWKAWKGESTVTQTGERSESINAMYGVERSEQGSRKDKKQENIRSTHGDQANCGCRRHNAGFVEVQAITKSVSPFERAHATSTSLTRQGLNLNLPIE